MTAKRRDYRCAALGAAIACVFASAAAHAETGYDAWLRYAPLEGAYAEQAREMLPAVIVPMGDSPIIQSAADELIRGVRGMTGRVLRVERELRDEPAIVVGTVVATGFVPGPERDDPRSADGYHVFFRERDGVEHLFVVGTNPRATLHAAFALLRRLATHQPLAGLDERTFAAAPIRIVNHWDNLDGSIERGYAGRSIFWDKGHVREDLTRVSDYGRLLASVGINGCSINNVNADVRVITPEYLPEVARIAEALRPWGVRVFLSLNFAAPREVGGIDTFDPLDPQAVAFWKETVDRVYEAVPDLGGFVLKADSEGRLGPSEYKRTHADAANVIAEAARPHGGTLLYRGFVYDHRMDWRDPKNDRATAAYNNFHPLDGKFLDNVVIQIKHGPIDFQVREPASPLFSGIPQTNKAIELQITQEYLGQQKHLCYVVPMWKDVLDFDMQAGPPDAPRMPVKALIGAGGGVGPGRGRGRGRPGSLGGFVGVSNVGLDENWLGHHLAMANLYGFGRLAWNPDLSSEQIADEWTRQTFGNDPGLVRTIVAMLAQSWEIYEQYTGNLGIGTLTDIIHVHFGPAPESSEYNGWGQWHRANETGVGMDRTVKSGTGFTAQYAPGAAALFESIATCPDELLLFFHHVPYTHVLRNGKTVIQHFYDEHYDGSERAAELVEAWKSLAGRIDEQRFQDVLARLEYQSGHAVVWRDAICRWFQKRSGVDDERGRVGVYPGRFEAEALELTGYESADIKPWEAASGSQAAQLPAGVEQGTATLRFDGEPGWYDLHVQYFDEEDGESRFRVLVNDQEVDAWRATDHVPTPTNQPDAHSSSWRRVGQVALRPGDAIRVEGTADRGERAGLDYVELVPTAP